MPVARGLVVAVALLGSLPASSQTVFRGAEVSAGIRAVDVHANLLQLLQGYAHYDDLLNYMYFTTRWAPGEFQFQGGGRGSGNLARFIGGAGFGAGTPSEYGVFGGIAVDAVSTTGLSGESYGGYQSLVYFGGALGSVELVLSGKVNFLQGGDGFDIWHNYRRSGESEHYRTALPFSTNDNKFEGDTFTLYENRSGAFVAVTMAAHGGAPTVSANLQPLARLLPNLWGLPVIGFALLDPGDGRGILDLPREVQTPIGTDDALGFGVRFRVVPQWYPTVQLKRAELGFVRSIGDLGADVPFGFGARVVLHRPEETYQVSTDAFASVGLYQYEEDKTPEGHAKYALFLAASYSYNSPDGTTFLPIADAHVFGFQLVWGRPETAKPLIPLIRSAPKKTDDAS